jgi:hypothetical protein
MWRIIMAVAIGTEEVLLKSKPAVIQCAIDLASKCLTIVSPFGEGFYLIDQRFASGPSVRQRVWATTSNGERRSVCIERTMLRSTTDVHRSSAVALPISMQKLKPKTCAVYWDLENVQIPVGADIRSLVDKLKAVCLPPACELRAFEAHCNVQLVSPRVQL